MTSISDVKLIIVTIEKDLPSYSVQSISKDMRKCDDIYLKAIENKWIKPKQTFFFINQGNLLTGDFDISQIKTDIMLIICSKLNEFRLSSFMNNNSLMQDISNIIMRPSLASTGIVPYLSSNITTLSNSTTDSTASIPVVPFNTTSDNLAPAFSPLNETSLGNISAATASAAGSQLMQEFQSSINNMLNSLNTSVIDPRLSTSSTPATVTFTTLESSESGSNNTQVNVGTVNPTTQSTVENNNVESNENDDVSTDTTGEQNNENNTEQSDIEINEGGTNVESVTNTLTQLLNIYQSEGTSTNLSSIRERYSNEYNEMTAMGFTDENRILMSLYVCEGNCENAINYYLSLQGD
jgi:hypothetical protein